MYRYEYTINKKINIDKFTLEVKQSDIKPDFYIIGYDANFKICFKEQLTTEEYNILQNIIENHDPNVTVTESEILKTRDNKLVVKPSYRPLYTSQYYTSRGDKYTTPTRYGNDEVLLEMHHQINDERVFIIEQNFNVENNRSWLYEGYLSFLGARNDTFTFEIVTRSTPYTISENQNTNFRISGGLIVPANGNGNIIVDVNNLYTLVSVTPRTDTGVYPKAYWDAKFDANTGRYYDLVPKPNGDGKYNMFATSVLLRRYINSVLMLGDGHLHFQANDPSELGTNLICRYIFETRGQDHEWWASLIISMFREKL